MAPDRERKAKAMPEIIDHVAYLSQQIGPRPAGTEEEQQAALYITEQFQKEAGLSAVIEDFNGAASSDLPRAICCAATLVVGALSLFVPMLLIPAIVVAVIALLLLAAEALDKPVLSKAFARGVSQNVVAKYEPGYTAEAGGTRRRKVVLVAHYDSGKVRAELKSPLINILPILRWANLGAMVATPILLALRATVLAHVSETMTLALNVIMVVLLVLVAVPVLEAIMHKVAAYNEAANCNASGVAVLLEVARRVGRGRVSDVDLGASGAQATVHGEQAARASGLVSEGAELVYAAANLKAPEPAPQSEAARLAAAKAAVAALTGKPVTSRYSADLSENLVQVKEPPLGVPTDADHQALRDETREALASLPPETREAALANAAMLEASEAVASEAAGVPSVPPAPPAPFAAAPAPSSEDGVPDWYKKAQEKAKKQANDKKPVQRSRYADALDAAMNESSSHFEDANDAVMSEMEARLQSMREGIMEVKAPQFERAEGSAQVESAAPAGAPFVGDATASSAVPQSAAEFAEGTPAPADASLTAVPVGAEEGATCAMPPIDVSELRLGDMPPVADVSMPSFLDPAKAQEEKLRERGEVQRTANRVDVTAAEVAASGRLEYASVPYDAAPMPEDNLQQSYDQGVPDQTDAPLPQRRPIVLPDIGVSSASPTPLSELPKQRAPLAEAETSAKSAAKSLLTMLPSIDPVQEAAAEADQSADTSAGAAAPARPNLRAALPSLSGSLPRSDESAVSAAGAFVPAGATGAFAPVGPELLDNVDPNDIYVDDADDSAYEGELTETGAFAGPGYVEMPKSRGRRFLDRLRFRKRKDEEEPTPQEWLEVDESFDARSVGAARGGWESFREGDEPAEQPLASAPYAESYEDDYYDDYATPTVTPASGGSAAGYEDDEEEEYVESYEAPYAAPVDSRPFNDGGFDAFAPLPYEDDFTLDDVEDDDNTFASDERPRWNGGGFSRRRMGRASDPMPEDEVDAVEVPLGLADDPSMPLELKEIYQFRNPDINTEVWFVALGAELAHQGGMRAFLAEHGQDLRGSIIIDIDALGAGALSMIEREGTYRKVKASSRMRRYTKKASQATGLSIESAALSWDDSAASIAIKQGFQAMHLAGMDGAKPAFFAQADDVLENIDGQTLEDNAEFVMELLKNI